MKYPTLFVNHGGGPMPLLGMQPDIVKHMKEAVEMWLPKEKPSSILVFSAHWESDPVCITAGKSPSMYYDYSGFPAESYKVKYAAPGSPELAQRVHSLLGDAGIASTLDDKRGFDHGVFVPLMTMYPDADIPVVTVSLDASLSAAKNIAIGRALAPLRDQDVLILGSGYTFHNMQAFKSTSTEAQKASKDFNEWLKEVIVGGDEAATGHADRLAMLEKWDKAPGARICHPREEHLLPLFMAAAAGGSEAKASLIYDRPSQPGDYQITAYMFE